MIDLFRSFSFAFSGLLHALRYERNFRIEWLCGLVVLLFANHFMLAAWQHAALIALTVVVLAFELLNSAVEKICDSSGLEFSLTKKHAKDVAAGAVLIVAIGAAVIFACIIATEFSHILAVMIESPWPFFLIALIFVMSLPAAITATPSVINAALFAVGLVTHGMLVATPDYSIILTCTTVALHLAWAVAFIRQVFSIKLAEKARA